MWMLVITLLKSLPKISIFYIILAKIGLAQYSLFLLILALVLDAVDYSAVLTA